MLIGKLCCATLFASPGPARFIFPQIAFLPRMKKNTDDATATYETESMNAATSSFHSCDRVFYTTITPFLVEFLLKKSTTTKKRIRCHIYCFAHLRHSNNSATCNFFRGRFTCCSTALNNGRDDGSVRGIAVQTNWWRLQWSAAAT